MLELCRVRSAHLLPSLSGSLWPGAVEANRVLSMSQIKKGCVLYIDLRPGETCHSKDGGSAYSIGVGKLGWQYGTGLKSHGTVTNWCTGREWPVNCMTVISARWRSNMLFQRRRQCIFRWPVMGRDWVVVDLLYNSVHRKFKQFLFWRSESWKMVL